MGGELKDVHKRKYDRVGALQKAWLMSQGKILSFKQFYLHRQTFILKRKKIRSETKITTFSHVSEVQPPPLVFLGEQKGSRTAHSAHVRKQKGNKCKLKHDILLESISREPEKQKYCRKRPPQKWA